MRNDRPTALMMKTLYSLMIQVGERPSASLSELSYSQVISQIDRLKRAAKEDVKIYQKEGSSFQERFVRTIDTSNDKELDWIGNQLSIQYFGRPCKVPIEWDKSLKHAAGFFSFDERSHKPIRIVQSMWQYNQFGAQHVNGTLKHELAHYHLFMEGRPFRDGEQAFIQECERIGAPLTAQAMYEGFITRCSACGAYSGLEKKERKKQASRCCKKPILFGDYILIFPDGLKVVVEK